MKTYLSLFSQPIHGLYAFIAIAMLLLSGCATQLPIVEEEPVDQTQKATTDVGHIPVVRYGRYALVEVDASSQHDILAQIIDVTIPVASQTQNTTVADAIRYVLLTSGYQLCDAFGMRIFENFSLPAMHQHLGPITLKDALTVLAGSGWNMQVDHFNRKICFAPENMTAEEVDATLIHKEGQQ